MRIVFSHNSKRLSEKNTVNCQRAFFFFQLWEAFAVSFFLLIKFSILPDGYTNLKIVEERSSLLQVFLAIKKQRPAADKHFMVSMKGDWTLKFSSLIEVLIEVLIVVESTTRKYSGHTYSVNIQRPINCIKRAAVIPATKVFFGSLPTKEDNPKNILENNQQLHYCTNSPPSVVKVMK